MQKNNDYIEEIAYRNLLRQKVCRGDKPTAEEKYWLATHRKFHTKMGYPCLCTDLIPLGKDASYRISVRILEKNGDVLPVFFAPAQKGCIRTNDPVVNIAGKHPTREVKMLGCTLDAEHPDTDFLYNSETGLLGVELQCTCYDAKTHLTKQEMSSRDHPDIFLRRTELSENCCEYRCHTPVSGDADSLVFTVTWQPEEP